MAAEDDKSNDFYAILGLKKECTAVELKIAYKKLALKWHPDRCAASGNSKYVEEAKKKFQAIQQAYSVLSDANKRFLYDVGVYDCNDHEDEADNGGESLGELQELFDEIFQSDIEPFSSFSHSSTPSVCSSFNGISSASNKRDSSEISSGNLKVGGTQFEGFCMGVECWGNNSREKAAGRRISARAGRSRGDCHDVSSSILIFLLVEDDAALSKQLKTPSRLSL
ncbi:dnaJ homolog subfamily B member 6-like isoform X2 [Olea europaea var. sylvestris]|uniref:dnaJ homolog subfamily B member 6-like isoform X2 n=1 Tax=Olea europaea var. sylvestris TaxID=158386 RepID=UPI000C1D49AE|nr:dnaJ homolog subfamily B member 6-like isoform X2 [Olea europaea var. sylvestris]